MEKRIALFKNVRLDFESFFTVEDLKYRPDVVQLTEFVTVNFPEIPNVNTAPVELKLVEAELAEVERKYAELRERQQALQGTLPA